MRTAFLLCLAACAESVPDQPETAPVRPPDTDVVSSAGSTSPTTEFTGWACRDDVAQGDLNGQYPSDELALPAFSATNLDGSARGPEDLRGQITVLWFYPKAGTAG